MMLPDPDFRKAQIFCTHHEFAVLVETIGARFLRGMEGHHEQTKFYTHLFAPGDPCLWARGRMALFVLSIIECFKGISCTVRLKLAKNQFILLKHILETTNVGYTRSFDIIPYTRCSTGQGSCKVGWRLLYARR